MRSTSFIVYTAGLLASLAAATSSATNFVCTPSVNGFGINSAATDVEDFCSTALRSNSSLLEKSYGLPYITFRFSKQAQLSACPEADCLNAFKDMFNNCE